MAPKRKEGSTDDSHRDAEREREREKKQDDLSGGESASEDRKAAVAEPRRPIRHLQCKGGDAHSAPQ